LLKVIRKKRYFCAAESRERLETCEEKIFGHPVGSKEKETSREDKQKEETIRSTVLCVGYRMRRFGAGPGGIMDWED